MKPLKPLLAAIALCAWFAGAGASPWGADLAALERAALEEDPVALTELALRYEHAEGLPKDFQKANWFYCRAARHGHAEAQFKLGWIYANGRGVPRNDGVAAMLFSMAAERGHAHAARLLQYIVARPGSQLPSCLLPDPERLAFESRTDEARLADIPARDRTEIEQLVYQLAPLYKIDPLLVLAVIRIESAFNPAAVSPKNAQGLMQLIPETAERFGVKRVFNPAENIRGGLAYLRWLLAFFEGDVALVAAAYNAGERAVERFRGIPPYPETRNYVRKITSLYQKASHPYEAGVVEASPVLARIRRPPG